MKFLEPKKQIEIILQNVEDIVPEEELFNKLKNSFENSKPLKIKAGFDPTSSDLHLGHSLLLRKLKVFQDLGHSIVFLIGDFTAMIGDPTGRDKTRPPLNVDDIEMNARTYKEQMFKILDERNIEILYNSDWYNDFSLNELINLSSQENVARLLERDDFKKRFKNGDAITVTEFLYPILQAYDSVVLKSDVELGGTDQRFNILLGRQIQKAYGVDEQVGIFLPILEGLDGTRKMSKSFNNYIGLNQKPDEMFGKVMSISDELMGRYINLLFNDETNFFNEIDSPLERKKALASRVVTEYHDLDSSNSAREDFDKKFSKKDFPENLTESRINLDNKSLLDILVEVSNTSFSRSELKRLIKDNALQINNKKINSLDFQAQHNSVWEVKIGKRNFYKIKFL